MSEINIDYTGMVAPIIQALAPAVTATVIDTAFGTTIKLSTRFEGSRTERLAYMKEPDQRVADVAMDLLPQLQREAVAGLGLEPYMAERELQAMLMLADLGKDEAWELIQLKAKQLRGEPT